MAKLPKRRIQEALLLDCSPHGMLIALADIFAVALSIYIGWIQIGKLFVLS